MWHRAWAPPPKLTPVEWVERHRILPAGVSSEPGPMRLERTPYVHGILNAAADPTIEEIVWVKPTQVAGSETLRNMLAYWIDADPGPTLIVMPDEKSAKEAIDERIRPMIESSPQLRRHLSDKAWDNKLTGIKLDTMSIFMGWAGSPQTLATRPCRRALFDETDKYPPFSGREADPISLGTERTATYGYRRKIYKTSTPTTREGPIWRAWEACGDRRHYHVPCPHCGAFQRLVWQQVKWPKLAEPDKVKLADNIEQNRLAWYECSACKGRIDDRHKPKMLSAGRWESETSGAVSKRVGFHLNAIYSPWRTFAAIAAEFVRADGDPGATMNFRNSWLAEPFENLVTKTRPSVIREKAKTALKPGHVSAEAVRLFATADTQQDRFYWTVRWWGYGYRSGLVANGVAWTFDELYQACLLSQFRHPDNTLWQPTHLLMDSAGSNKDSKRTDEVYGFVTREPGRIIPTKGASHEMRRPLTEAKQPNGLVLRWVDTLYFKDILASLLNDQDQTKWMPHADVDEDYCQQLASEHKILDRKTGRMRWKPATEGAANHFWDCEVLQCVAYYMANLHQVAAIASRTPAPKPTPERPGGFNTPDGRPFLISQR